MVSSRVIVLATCLLVFQVYRIHSQAISSEAYSSSSISSGGSQCGGGQIIIPAIIKPVMQPEAPAPIPCVPDFGGYYRCAMPPIIIEEGGSSGKNDLLWPLILIMSLRNNGGSQCSSGNSGYGVGCYGYPGCPMPCGFGGYNTGYGYGCCCGNSGYGGCNCGGCNYCNGCDDTPQINIVISTSNCTTS